MIPEEPATQYEEFECPDCDSDAIITTSEKHSFIYGSENDKVEITVEVPIRTCQNCGFSFMDHEGEEICHEAVCKHLGVMTPDQIRSLRQTYNMTQANFAQITGLGEATLSRWERGIIIQNQAYDNFLYLLKLPMNFEMIKNRHHKDEKNIRRANKIEKSRFRVLKLTEELEKRNSTFRLRPIVPERLAKCM